MSASRMRFASAHLFYALSLSAAATGLFGVGGIPVAAFVILVWSQIFSGVRREASQATIVPQHAPDRGCPGSSRKGGYRIELAVVLLLSAILLGLLLPAEDDSDSMAQAATSMKLIAKAVANYERETGTRLTPVVYDSTGKPMHSWRALILKSLGEERLAAAYHWDEPWDGPNNSKLAKFRPWHFRTYYPEQEFDRAETTLHGVLVEEQFCVVEQEQVPSNWLEPSTMPADVWNRLNRMPEVGDGFWQRGFFTSIYRGRLAVFGDRSETIGPATDLSNVQKRSQVASGEASLGGNCRIYHYDNALRLSFFLLVVFYPIRWLKQIPVCDQQNHVKPLARSGVCLEDDHRRR